MLCCSDYRRGHARLKCSDLQWLLTCKATSCNSTWSPLEATALRAFVSAGSFTVPGHLPDRQDSPSSDPERGASAAALGQYSRLQDLCRPIPNTRAGARRDIDEQSAGEEAFLRHVASPLISSAARCSTNIPRSPSSHLQTATTTSARFAPYNIFGYQINALSTDEYAYALIRQPLIFFLQAFLV